MRAPILSAILYFIALLFCCNIVSAQQKQPSLKDLHTFPATQQRLLPASYRGAGRGQGDPSVHKLSSFNYPLEDCFTYTFKLNIGAPDKKTVIRGSYTDHDNETYLAGYIEDISGSRSGLLQQLGFVGNLGWSATISLPGKNILFNDVKQLSNGSVTLLGTVADVSGNNSYILMAKFSAAGVLTWCRRLNSIGFEGAQLAENKSGGFDFTAQNTTDMLYGRTDAAGSLVWLKKIQLLDSGRVVGITGPTYDKLFIAYTGMKNGRHMGIFLRVNVNTGEIISSETVGNETENYIFHDMKYEGNTIDVCGIVSINGNAYKLFKIMFRESGQDLGIQQFDVPGTSFDTTASSSLTSRAKVLAFRPSKNDAFVYTVKLMEEAAYDRLSWAKKISTGANAGLMNIERTFDGGFLLNTAVTTSATNTISSLVKMDSSGLIKGCPALDYSISNVVSQFNFIMGNPAFQNLPSALIDEAPQSSAGAPASSFTCRSLSCEPRLPDEQCLQSFVKEYRSSEYSDLGINIIAGNNELIFSGTMRPDPVNSAEEFTTLGKFDLNGKLLERKLLVMGFSNSGAYMKKLHEGSFLLVGSCSYTSGFSSNDTGYRTITKYSASLNVIWRRAFPSSQTSSDANALTEGSDGSIYYHYTNDLSFCLRTSVLKLTPDGNLVWSKKYDVPTDCSLSNQGCVTQDENFLYALTFTETGNLLMKINKVDGSPVFAKSIMIPTASQRNFYTMEFLGGNIVLKGIASYTSSSGDVLVKINTDGQLIASTLLSFNGNYAYLPTVFTQSNEIVMAQGEYFIRLDQNFQVINSKRNSFPGPAGYGICEGATGNIYLIGYGSIADAYSLSVSLRKYTADGKLGSCATDTLIFSQSNINIQITGEAITAIDQSVTFTTLPYSEWSYSLQESKLLCGAATDCTQLSVNAPAAICSNETFEITAVRNAGCTLPVSFSFNNQNLQVVSSTPTSVFVKFIASGSTIVTARLYTGCVSVSAAATINGTVAGNVIGLGPDDIICTGNTKILHAGPGYMNYQWDDQSTDSIRAITAPGTYFVQASDACGHMFYDTIRIREFTTSISIGADRFKCDNDTLHLNAAPGFISYAWGPAYNISTLSGMQTIVNPAVDTSYFIKAAVSPGCFAYDTVKIKVKHGTPINLGADKSFCSGDSVILNAGAGFSSYLWSNGTIGQRLKVMAAGNYFVTVINAEGCPSKDTMQVLRVYTTPQVQLGADFPLCKGMVKTLDAGVYATYVWSNSSSGRSLQVSTPGWYWVKVTDANNCKGGDSIRLLNLLALPAAFLPKDTAICSYETIQLASLQNYNAYRWSEGGSSSKTITVSHAGLYWLEVQDNNNCTGRDSIMVKNKDCIAGFYMPTAFTPDGTPGKNDVFKPLIFGNIIRYHFSIYNRYGQLLFQTTDTHQGWDGKMKGVSSNGNAFVWICTYQFAGSREKTEKGSFLLIR